LSITPTIRRRWNKWTVQGCARCYLQPRRLRRRLLPNMLLKKRRRLLLLRRRLEKMLPKKPATFFAPLTTPLITFFAILVLNTFLKTACTTGGTNLFKICWPTQRPIFLALPQVIFDTTFFIACFTTFPGLSIKRLGSTPVRQPAIPMIGEAMINSLPKALGLPETTHLNNSPAFPPIFLLILPWTMSWKAPLIIPRLRRTMPRISRLIVRCRLSRFRRPRLSFFSTRRTHRPLRRRPVRHRSIVFLLRLRLNRLRRFRKRRTAPRVRRPRPRRRLRWCRLCLRVRIRLRLRLQFTNLPRRLRL